MPSLKSTLRCALAVIPLAAWAQPDFGDGSDGPLTVNSNTTIDAAVAQLTASSFPGDNTLDVSSTAGFAIGDEVMIVQVVDSFGEPPGGSAGRFEFAEIQNVSGSVLTLTGPVTYNYFASGSDVAQVVEVKQYSSVSVLSGRLSPPDFDYFNSPFIGGILAMRCTGTVQVASSAFIDAQGDGFQGGLNVGPATTGFPGDSYTGFVLFGDTAANAGGGGGGQGGSISGSGGGGAGYATGGQSGLGSSGGQGGGVYGIASLALLHLGSGGGSGGGGLGNSGGGGDGGGIVFIAADQITVNASGGIRARGSSGSNSPSFSGAGGGGGGAGGSVFLIAGTLNVQGTVSAVGGGGGIGEGSANSGGGGGNGRIYIEHVDPIIGLPNIEPTPTTEQVSGEPPTAVGDYSLYR